MQSSIGILVAEDDPDDRLMIKDAFEENCVSNPVTFVKDGEELMDYLYRRGSFGHLRDEPFPGIILLDLNMPKKDGREALAEIKSNPSLKQIPIVVMTTSKAQEDIATTYDLGVNSFVKKPVSYDELVKIMQRITNYWLDTVELPQ